MNTRSAMRTRSPISIRPQHAMTTSLPIRTPSPIVGWRHSAGRHARRRLTRTRPGAPRRRCPHEMTVVADDQGRRVDHAARAHRGEAARARLARGPAQERPLAQAGVPGRPGDPADPAQRAPVLAVRPLPSWRPPAQPAAANRRQLAQQLAAQLRGRVAKRAQPQPPVCLVVVAPGWREARAARPAANPSARPRTAIPNTQNGIVGSPMPRASTWSKPSAAAAGHQA